MPSCTSGWRHFSMAHHQIFAIVSLNSSGFVGLRWELNSVKLDFAS